jgi:hypothetical protein
MRRREFIAGPGGGRSRRRGDRVKTRQPPGEPATLGNASFVAAIKEVLWLSCLLWGILLMISAATEGIPYTSIHIRGELLQDAVGAFGLFLAVVGVVVGFSVGKKRK